MSGDIPASPAADEVRDAYLESMRGIALPETGWAIVQAFAVLVAAGAINLPAVLSALEVTRGE